MKRGSDHYATDNFVYLAQIFQTVHLQSTLEWKDRISSGPVVLCLFKSAKKIHDEEYFPPAHGSQGKQVQISARWNVSQKGPPFPRQPTRHPRLVKAFKETPPVTIVFTC